MSSRSSELQKGHRLAVHLAALLLCSCTNLWGMHKQVSHYERKCLWPELRKNGKCNTIQLKTQFNFFFLTVSKLNMSQQDEMMPRSCFERSYSVSDMSEKAFFHSCALPCTLKATAHTICFAHERSPHYCSHIKQSHVNFMPHWPLFLFLSVLQQCTYRLVSKKLTFPPKILNWNWGGNTQALNG